MKMLRQQIKIQVTAAFFDNFRGCKNGANNLMPLRTKKMLLIYLKRSVDSKINFIVPHLTLKA